MTWSATCAASPSTICSTSWEHHNRAQTDCLGSGPKSCGPHVQEKEPEEQEQEQEHVKGKVKVKGERKKGKKTKNR